MIKEKEIKEIELLINENNLQGAIHKINDLAYSILDEDIECNFMHDVANIFIQKELLMMVIGSEDRISKMSKIQIDDMDEDLYYYWQYITSNKIKISEVTKEKLFNVLDNIEEFLTDYSVAI